MSESLERPIVIIDLRTGISAPRITPLMILIVVFLKSLEVVFFEGSSAIASFPMIISIYFSISDLIYTYLDKKQEIFKYNFE
jgi:hypothetical protein